MACFTMMAKFLSQPLQIRSLTTVGIWPGKDLKLNKNIKVYNLEEEVKGGGVQNWEQVQI